MVVLKLLYATYYAEYGPYCTLTFFNIAGELLFGVIHPYKLLRETICSISAAGCGTAK